MSEIKFENNANVFRAEYVKKKNKILYELGLKWQKIVTELITKQIYSKDPVGYKLTGRLRASLTFVTPYKISPIYPVEKSKPKDFLRGKSDDMTVTVGSNVEYAEKINNKYNFIEESITGYTDSYKNITEQILKE